MTNPWLIVVALVAIMGLAGGAYWWGDHNGRNSVIAAQSHEDALVRKVAEAAQSAAADAIAKIEVKRVTITQPLQTEIREKPVYRDCAATPDGLRLVNEALTGEAAPAGGGQLPGAAAPH